MKNWRLTRQSRADGPRAAAPCKGAACGPPLISDVMRLDQMWLNLTRAIVVAIASVALPVATLAADGTLGGRYKPVFEVKLAADSGTIVAAYLRAYRSPTPEVAIKRWENFLGEYAEGDS